MDCALINVTINKTLQRFMRFTMILYIQ